MSNLGFHPVLTLKRNDRLQTIIASNNGSFCCDDNNF